MSKAEHQQNQSPDPDVLIKRVRQAAAEFNEAFQRFSDVLSAVGGVPEEAADESFGIVLTCPACQNNYTEKRKPGAPGYGTCSVKCHEESQRGD